MTLRQRYNLKLGDSIVAAMALIYDLSLMTRNTKDFKWLDGIQLINPFENVE